MNIEISHKLNSPFQWLFFAGIGPLHCRWPLQKKRRKNPSHSVSAGHGQTQKDRGIVPVSVQPSRSCPAEHWDPDEGQIFSSCRSAVWVDRESAVVINLFKQYLFRMCGSVRCSAEAVINGFPFVFSGLYAGFNVLCAKTTNIHIIAYFFKKTRGQMKNFGFFFIRQHPYIYYSWMETENPSRAQRSAARELPWEHVVSAWPDYFQVCWKTLSPCRTEWTAAMPDRWSPRWSYIPENNNKLKPQRYDSFLSPFPTP